MAAVSVAGASTGAAQAVGPNLQARRVGRHAGAPTVVQFVCLELAVVIVAGAAWANPLLLAFAVVPAIVLLVVVFGRAGGRWWYEAYAARRRLRQRRRQGARALSRLAAAEPRAAAMATLASGLTIRNVLDRGRSIGVGSDEQGWFAGVAVGTWTDVSGDRAFRLDLQHIVRILDESTIPISALQLLSFSTQAPAGLVDGAGPAMQSYRELTAPAGCPLDQAVWLAVRLAPADALEAASSRGGGVTGVDRALAAAIGRIEKTLAGMGVPYRVLDADGLGDALTLSCGLAALAHDTGGGPVAREHWTGWLAGGLEHVCYTVTNWPQNPEQDLFAELTLLPACAVAVSIVMRERGGEVAFLGMIRVVVPPRGLRTATRQLNATVRRVGLRLRRLDGEQARAVYATAPTGGIAFGGEGA